MTHAHHPVAARNASAIANRTRNAMLASDAAKGRTQRTQPLLAVVSLHDLGKDDAKRLGGRTGLIGQPPAARSRVVPREKRQKLFGFCGPSELGKVAKADAIAVDAGGWTDNFARGCWDLSLDFSGFRIRNRQRCTHDNSLPNFAFSS
jgi:hypothetical protein